MNYVKQSVFLWETVFSIIKQTTSLYSDEGREQFSLINESNL